MVGKGNVIRCCKQFGNGVSDTRLCARAMRSLLKRAQGAVILSTPNDGVEKVRANFFAAKLGSRKPPPDTTIVDPGSFCEADFWRRSFEYFHIGLSYSLNDGVEKPNSEPRVQDLESYFCRRRLSCRGAISFFDSIHGDPLAAFNVWCDGVRGRLDVFNAAIPSVSDCIP